MKMYGGANFTFFVLFCSIFLTIICHEKVKGQPTVIRSSFEQNWLTLCPRGYVPRISLKAYLVLEKKIFKGFIYHIYGHSGHFVQ